MKQRFSQRMGIKPARDKTQIDSVDDELRSRLWNIFVRFCWKDLWGTDAENLVHLLWDRYFKKPVNPLLHFVKLYPNEYEEVKKYFFECPWYEVYDFLEFVANYYFNSEHSIQKKFTDVCNNVLEQELSAYRFVKNKIAPITQKEEISEIEEALEVTEPLKGVNTHLKSALEKLADRRTPDYRNSIKESISAVESLCRLITKNEKVTLGEALKKMDDKIGIHPALKEAFSKLYGYASDADGIRHALLEECNLSFEDAKFMLVSCSAFVNYLISKAEKSGIEL